MAQKCYIGGLKSAEVLSIREAQAKGVAEANNALPQSSFVAILDGCSAMLKGCAVPCRRAGDIGAAPKSFY
jgi:hypothetical protein